MVRRITDAKYAGALECGGTTPLFPDATHRVIPKRGRVRALQTEFTTADAYTFERELEQLHPDNKNVRPKIRQELQELRDRNLLLHVGRNYWRLP